MNLSRLLLRLALGRRLPVRSGELRIPGLTEPITVRRDAYGVPHIEAASETDAHFAHGFCQGQDRAGQLEVIWRVACGRLAEWVGPGGIGLDRMSRRIGFRRAAEKQYAVLIDEARDLLSAFAKGVSAGITLGLPQKPHEFAIVGGEPSPWNGIDVLAVLKLQSFALASNWDVELARLRILLSDGPDALRALDPVSLSAQAVEPNGIPVSAFDRLVSDLTTLQEFLPFAGGGSNNWVIAGSRTASGKPLLASDPHLGPSSPPPWYLAHIRCPQWDACGAGLAGTPSFAIGHNGFAAWGVTAGLTDNSDLFIEQISADGHTAREADGTFQPCQVVREVIRVKGAEDLIEAVVITPRGPVLSPLIAGIPFALSLKAVWLEPLPLEGFLAAVRTKSFDDFRRSFAAWPALPLNLVYADVNGSTGWQLIGQLPRRAGGHGLLPRPAFHSESGWPEMVPFEEMPYLADFPNGYFATANANPVPDSFTPWLGADYCDPYRVRTITEALAARDTGWTADDCLALQRDLRSIPWEEIRDSVLSLSPSDPAAQEAIQLLQSWDGRIGSESPAACVFELFTSQMCERVTRAKAPKTWLTAMGETGLGSSGHSLFSARRVGHLVPLIREQPPGWFASWPEEMERVLGDVVRNLRKTVGPGPAYWAWGHLRQLRIEHPLFKNHRQLGPAFNLGPIPCGGDSNTISQASVRPAEPTALAANIATLRTVFDLADLTKSRFILCGGQSGNPLSEHHADQLPLWRIGETIAIPWHQVDVIRSASHTLRLLPAG